jgi:hypothetical protein
MYCSDDTEKPADGGERAEGVAADGVLADELKAMSLDSGSSTDADVDSDSGSWSSRSSRSLVYVMTRKTEDSQNCQAGLCEILLLVGGPGKIFWLGLLKCG